MNRKQKVLELEAELADVLGGMADTDTVSFSLVEKFVYGLFPTTGEELNFRTTCLSCTHYYFGRNSHSCNIKFGEITLAICGEYNDRN
jgi:hypothetical protein